MAQPLELEGHLGELKGKLFRGASMATRAVVPESLVRGKQRTICPFSFWGSLGSNTENKDLSPEFLPHDDLTLKMVDAEGNYRQHPSATEEPRIQYFLYPTSLS